MSFLHVESKMIVRTPKIKAQFADHETQEANSTDPTDDYNVKPHVFRKNLCKRHVEKFSINVFLGAAEPSKLHKVNPDKFVNTYFQLTEKLNDKVSNDVIHV